MDSGICYQHDSGNPTLLLIGDSCVYHWEQMERSGKAYCDFDLMSGEFAWIDEMNQHINSIEDYDVENKESCPAKKEDVYGN